MNWKLKATLQNAIALLPSSGSYAAYYWIQRHFGALRQLNPVSRLVAGVDVSKRIEQIGRSPVGGVFLEVGTGRRINTPLAFWLMGADRVLTVDLNPYVKEELVREDLNYIREHREEVERLFEGRIHGGRLDELVEFAAGKWQLADLLQRCRIDYLAPADASQLPIPAQSVDFHTSFTVLEHIPPHVIEAILQEGSRIVKSDGVFIHHVDCSDHFSHSDRTISPIHFLQFSDDRWSKIAGNRYAYMNRLRVDDLGALFQAAGQEILLDQRQLDPAIPELLEKERLRLDERFAGKAAEVLAATRVWIVAGKRPVSVASSRTAA